MLALDNPARQSFVVEIVGADRVLNAVALNSVVVHCSRILGPAAAGTIIALVGIAPCFAVNAFVVPGDVHRAADDGPVGAAHAEAGGAGARRVALRVALRPARRPSC